MGLNRIFIGALLVFSSTTSAQAGFLSWLIDLITGGSGSGGGGGGGHSVPEIDAFAGMGVTAIVIGVALIVREKFLRK